MPDSVALPGEAVLEVVSPDGARRFARITQTPFHIGRGAETGNHLQLSDRRISRNCAAIVTEANRYYLEDRGQRRGLFVNGEKVESRELQNGDAISFGLEDSYEIIFRNPPPTPRTNPFRTCSLASNTSLRSEPDRHGGLAQIEFVAGSDHAAAFAVAARFRARHDAGSRRLGYRCGSRIAAGRRRSGEPEGSPGAPQRRLCVYRRKVLRPARPPFNSRLKQHSPVITEDLAQADMDLQAAQSIVAQRLRAVVVIPLYAMSRANTQESMINIKRGDFLGVLYMDSRRPAAFSKLDRQILDALAADAASILDNARLVERERERQRMEQEINIARDIQQALLPRDFREFPHLAVSGINFPCLSVGGDYFDVFPLSDNRTAFLIADVSGKGLGAALLTTMLQGALSGMTLGTDPARVFNHVNKFLCSHSEVGRYATMFFGILDEDGQSRIHQRRPSVTIFDSSRHRGRALHRRLLPGGLGAGSGIRHRLRETRARRHVDTCSATASPKRWIPPRSCTVCRACAKSLPDSPNARSDKLQKVDSRVGRKLFQGRAPGRRSHLVDCALPIHTRGGAHGNRFLVLFILGLS